MSDRQFLFICGIARSGTTALTRVLNSHSQIGIGMERFKQITGIGKFRRLLVPELFSKERFFDFQDRYTNMTPEHSEAMCYYYDQLREKFDTLSYIGDKVPNSFRTVKHVHDQFPNVKHIFVARDIFDTACSWHARAKSTTDNWSPKKDATYAVFPWNETNLTYLRLKEQFPEDFYMVDYHAFFDADRDNYSQLTDICEYLNLPVDLAMTRSYRAACDYHQTRVKTKSRHLDPQVLQYIVDNADLDAYQAATGRTTDLMSSLDTSQSIDLRRASS